MKNKCKICGYEWESRFENRIPKQCPRCKGYKWQGVEWNEKEK